MQIENHKIFETSGILQKGFQGNITYDIKLPDHLENLQVMFHFENPSSEQLTNGIIDQNRHIAIEYTSDPDIAEMNDQTNQKTEINVSFFAGNTWLGSIHRNDKIKEIEIGSQCSSEGFLTWRLSGVLRVVLDILNVVPNDIDYSLVLKEAN